MILTPPKIDHRDQKKFADKLRELIAYYAPEYPDALAVATDPQANSLAELFARLMEIIAQRLNRTPDKNFFAFLEMLGMELTSPNAARAPLEFKLGEGADVNVSIPAGTSVAAEGGDEGILFETGELLTVLRSNITDVRSVAPARDKYTDHQSFISAPGENIQTLLGGITPLPHRIYVGHSEHFSYKEKIDIKISVELEDNVLDDGADKWRVKWYTYKEGENDPVELIPESASPETDRVVNLVESGDIIFKQVDKIVPHTITGLRVKSESEEVWPTLAKSDYWIYAELQTGIADWRQAPVEGIVPDAAYLNNANEDNLFDTSVIFSPFGATPSLGDKFYLASKAAFSQTNSTAVINIKLDPGSTAYGTVNTSDVQLEVSYWNGAAWVAIGRTSYLNGVTSEPGHHLEDSSNVLSQDGAIKFFCPQFASQVLNTIESLWVRLEIVAGDFGTGTPEPPTLASMTLSYSSIPEIKKIKTSVLSTSNSESNPLEIALNNTEEIDISKDFLPFGESPLFNDAFNLGSSTAFSNEGTDITITCALSDGAPFPQPTMVTLPDDSIVPSLSLRWEYYDGVNWEKIGETKYDEVVTPGEYEYTDSTNAFTTDGTITFKLPKVVASEVGGELNHWVRVRIVEGGYGIPGYLDGTTWIPDNFTPPSFSTFDLSYVFDTGLLEGEISIPTPNVLVENEYFLEDYSETIKNNKDASEPVAFQYFKRSLETSPALYIGFDQDVSNLPVNLFFPLVSHPFNSTAASQDIESPTIYWEYWNGVSWSFLTVDDATKHLSSRDMVKFLLPGDGRMRPVFGVERFWIRLRLNQGEFILNPRMAGIHSNVVWAENSTTISEELLGSSNGEPRQKFIVSQAPILDGQKLIVIEPSLTEEERNAVIAAEGEDAIIEKFDEAGDVTETRVRWHEVSRFETSSPQSRHYILDNITGEVYFGDGKMGFIPPVGQNNIILESYKIGGGLAGNVAVGEISGLQEAIALVDSVSNPVVAEGGIDRETLDGLRERGPRNIKSRDRAVTPDDFDGLVLASTPRVARVKTMPTINPNFEFSPGWTNIIIVPVSDDDKPFPTQELINYVEDYVHARSSTHLIAATPDQINVIGPGYIKVYVEADIVYDNISEVKVIEALIVKKLNKFFNALTGGPSGDGWEFGRNVYSSEVYELLEGVQGVDYVKNLILHSSGQSYNLTLEDMITPLIPYPSDNPILITGARPGDIQGKMIFRVAETLREDIEIPDVSVVGFKEGDLIKLQNVNPINEEVLNEVSLILTSVMGGTLLLDTTYFTESFPAGSVIISGDGKIRSTLLENVDAGNEISELKSAVPESGDVYELTHQNSSVNRHLGSVETSTEQVKVVFLGDNFLTYPGEHIIRAAQSEETV